MPTREPLRSIEPHERLPMHHAEVVGGDQEVALVETQGGDFKIQTQRHEYPLDAEGDGDVKIEAENVFIINKAIDPEDITRVASIDDAGIRGGIHSKRTFLVALKDGSLWIYKQTGDEERDEIFAYRLASKIFRGIVPETIPMFVPGLGWGSAQRKVTGIPAGRVYGLHGYFHGNSEMQADLASMVVLDYLIGNPDRHANNWFLMENDRLAAIDNGWAGEEPVQSISFVLEPARLAGIVNDERLWPGFLKMLHTIAREVQRHGDLAREIALEVGVDKPAVIAMLRLWEPKMEKLIQYVEREIKKPLQKARPSRFKCMECDKPPVWECRWAEGLAHAWFCAEHKASWLQGDGKGEVVSERDIDGEAAEKWSEPKSEVKKARIYVNTPQEAPPGAHVEEGPRGGLYYESEPMLSSEFEKPRPEGPMDAESTSQSLVGVDFEEQLGLMGEVVDAEAEEWGIPHPQENRDKVKDAIVSTISKDTGLSYRHVNKYIKTWAESSSDSSYTSLALQMAASELFDIEPTEFVKAGWHHALGNKVRFESPDSLAQISMQNLVALRKRIKLDWENLKKEYSEAYEADLAGSPPIQRGLHADSPEQIAWNHYYIAKTQLIGEWQREHKEIQENYQENLEDLKDPLSSAKKIIRAIYDNTQDFLNKHGVTELVLTRGMNWMLDAGDNKPPEVIVELISEGASDGYITASDVNFHANPLSSWSYNPDTAASFASGTPDDMYDYGENEYDHDAIDEALTEAMADDEEWQEGEENVAAHNAYERELLEALRSPENDSPVVDFKIRQDFQERWNAGEWKDKEYDEDDYEDEDDESKLDRYKAHITEKFGGVTAWADEHDEDGSYLYHTYYPSIARMLGCVRVPAARIISTSMTGMGCLGEYEVVVAGGLTKQRAYAMEDEHERGGLNWTAARDQDRGENLEGLGLDPDDAEASQNTVAHEKAFSKWADENLADLMQERVDAIRRRADEIVGEWDEKRIKPILIEQDSARQLARQQWEERGALGPAPEPGAYEEITRRMAQTDDRISDLQRLLTEAYASRDESLKEAREEVEEPFKAEGVKKILAAGWKPESIPNGWRPASWVPQGKEIVNAALKKARVYLRPGEHPPEGFEEKKGPRGGRYYESQGRSPGANEPASNNRPSVARAEEMARFDEEYLEAAMAEFSEDFIQYAGDDALEGEELRSAWKRRVTSTVAEKIDWSDSEDSQLRGDGGTAFQSGLTTQNRRESEVNAFIKSWAQSSSDSNENSLALQMATASVFGIEPNPFVLKAWREKYPRRGSQMYTVPDPARDAEDDENRLRFAKKVVQAVYDRTQRWFRVRGIKSVYLARGMKFGDYDDTTDVGKLPTALAPEEDLVEIEKLAKRIWQHYDEELKAIRTVSVGNLSGKEYEEARRAEDARYWSEREAIEKQRERDLAPVLKLWKENRSWEGAVDFQPNPLSSWSSSVKTAYNFTTTLGDNATASAIVYAEVPVENILSTPFTGMGCLNEREFVLTGKTMPVFFKAVRPRSSVPIQRSMTWAEKEDWLTAHADFTGYTEINENQERLAELYADMEAGKITFQEYQKIYDEMTGKGHISDELLTKARIYLKPGEEPPPGVAVKEGPRGGHYYEGGTRGAAAPEGEGRERGDPRPSPERRSQMIELEDVYREATTASAREWQEKEYRGRYSAEFVANSNDHRVYLKKKIAARIAEKTGLHPDKTGEYVSSWAETSSDSCPESLALQMAAAELFGQEPTEFVKKAWDERMSGPMQGFSSNGKTYAENRMDEARLVLRAVYEDTQNWLKERGIEKLYLARGMHFGFETPAPPELSPELSPENAKFLKTTKLRALKRIEVKDLQLIQEKRESGAWDEETANKSLRRIRRMHREARAGVDYMLENDPYGLIGSVMDTLMEEIDQQWGEGYGKLHAKYKHVNEDERKEKLDAFHAEEKALDTKLRADKLQVRIRMGSMLRGERTLDYYQNPLSSWSSDLPTARNFATRAGEQEGAVLYAEIPAEKVVTNPFTGMGCLTESEWLIAGGTVHCYARMTPLRNTTDSTADHWLEARDLFSTREQRLQQYYNSGYSMAMAEVWVDEEDYSKLSPAEKKKMDALHEKKAKEAGWENYETWVRALKDANS